MQWYKQKGKNDSIGYVIEDLDPSISISRDLIITGFDNYTVTQMGKQGMQRLNADVRNVTNKKSK